MPQRIDEIAASWIARIDRGLSAAENDELHAWLSSEDAHAAAFQRLSVVWNKLNIVAGHDLSGKASVFSLLGPRGWVINPSRRRIALIIIALIIAIVVAWLRINSSA